MKDTRCRQAGDPHIFSLMGQGSVQPDYLSESTDTEEQQLEEKICP